MHLTSILLSGRVQAQRVHEHVANFAYALNYMLWRMPSWPEKAHLAQQELRTASC